MRDPTRDEMLEALAMTIACIGEGAQDEAEVAMYWFANDYHGGQWSNLYSVLSTSPYSPGPIATLESEGDIVGMLYRELEQEFSPH